MSKKYPSFYEKLQQATNEDKQVNEIYKHALAKEFSKYRNDDVNDEALQIDIDNPIYIKTDGIFKCTCIKSKDSVESIFYMLMECKLDEDFNNPKERAKVLTQVVAYLAQINYMLMNNSQGAKARATFGKTSNELQMPSVIFIGSKISCFVVDNKLLKKYYDRNLDFGDIKGASTFYKTETGKIIFEQLEKDADINVNCQIFKTSDKFCLFDVVDLIYKYGSGENLKSDFQPRTLYRAFTRFTARVLTVDTVEKLSNRQLTSLFAQFIVNSSAIDEVNSLNGSLKKLVINGIDLKVNSMEWNAFRFAYNTREYSNDEQKAITAIMDQLLESDDRSRKGDYYTPAIWVNESQKLLDKNLEQGWRSKYMVWDCAWGTGNLTRDCTRENILKDLYCSTLEQQGLDIGTRYNPSATKFQYDFLNDDVSDFEDAKEHLRDALRAFTNEADIIERNANFRAVIDLIQKSLESDNENLVKKARQAVASLRAALNIIEDTKLYAYAPDLVDGLLGRRTETEQSAEELGTLRQNLGIKGEPKKLLFYINPPYKTSKNNTVNKGEDDDTSSAGVAKNEINSIAVAEGYGLASRQLYTLFLFRIIRIADLFGNSTDIGWFTQSDFLSTCGYEKMRKSFYNRAKYIDGFLLRGNEFQGVSKDVAISFTLFKLRSTEKTSRITLKIYENKNNSIEYIGEKIISPVEQDQLFNKKIRTDQKNEWNQSKKNNSSSDDIELVSLKQALNIRDDAPLKKYPSNCIGGFQCNANAVNYNDQFVALYSAPFHGAANLIVTKNNIMDVVQLFTARRLIQGNKKTWYNWKDEYQTPNKSDERYVQFENDSIVYQLFESKQQQSQIRNIDYNGRTWNIKNEFFWLSERTIENWANCKDVCNNSVIDDIDKFYGDRFVYKKLQDITLSPDAQAVLDKATEIVKKSFKYRDSFNKEHPEYNINTWDAGWYQIKGLCKATPEMQQDMKEFDELYKKFGDRMRPLVYELGFFYK